jgi:hypothetical protein
MPRPAGRPDGQETHAPRAAAVLRGGGFALAVALGAVAVWLIVTSTTQKRLELGVLAGLWGLLLGAFCAFGTRRGHRDELTMPVPGPGQELAERAAGNVELADESAARRHFEARLEQMLRQEIQTTLGREIASLRDEVASLRNDLLEKVGGQLRLERIETTRVIGSDIEALQREIDQLKHGRPVVDLVDAGPITRTIPRIIETSPVPPSQQQPVPPAQQQPVRPQPQPVQAPPQPAPVRQPAPVQQPQPQPVQEQPQPQAQPPVSQPASQPRDGDVFADLPRLRPFTDFELDPAPSAPAEPQDSDEPAADEQGEPPMLAPRRPESGRAATGRHGRADDADRDSGAGRRRRAANDEDNVLARILARENSR